MVSFWIHTLTYPSVIWFVVFSISPDDLLSTSCRSVRLSILLSILRITSPSRNLRQVMVFIAGLFVLMWFSLMIMLLRGYVSSHHFGTAASQQDGEGTRPLAIFELIGTSFSLLVFCILNWDTADILSDCLLVSLPIHSLRSIKLPRPQRRLIIAAFSSSIFVTVVSSFRAVCQLFNISPFISVAIDVEVCDRVVRNPKFSHSI